MGSIGTKATCTRGSEEGRHGREAKTCARRSKNTDCFKDLCLFHSWILFRSLIHGKVSLNADFIKE